MRKVILALLLFAPASYIFSHLARSSGSPMWVQSMFILFGMSLVGAAYIVVARINPRLTGWEADRRDDLPRIRIDLAGALIGMAALNATVFSVMIREPGLFVLAILGNIALVIGICWLARDKGNAGAGHGPSEQAQSAQPETQA